MTDTKPDKARELLRRLLKTREAEAKATLIARNAEENYSDPGQELDLLQSAMVAASEAEKEARAYLAAHDQLEPGAVYAHDYAEAQRSNPLRRAAMERAKARVDATPDQPQAASPIAFTPWHRCSGHGYVGTGPCPKCATPAAEPDVGRHIRAAIGQMHRFDIPSVASAMRAALRSYGEECRAAERERLCRLNYERRRGK